MSDQPKHEEIRVNGEDIVRTVKQLIQQGNIRRIIILNEKGDSLVEFPFSVGVVGALLVPVLAAIGALAALLSKCTIIVERR